MPALQVRDIPQDIYDGLVKLAKEENRSLAQETVVLLRLALKNSEERMTRRKRVLLEIAELDMEPDPAMPDPAKLVREDRER